MLDPLKDRNELIAYSFPGHPGSPLPGHQYGAAELTEQLRAVALREGLHKFHLMGISLGGSVAQHFADERIHVWVDKLDVSLADCTPRYDDESRANWPLRATAARRDGVPSLIPFLMQVFFTKDSLDQDGPNVRHVRETFQACDGEAYALACETLAMLDAREQTRQITAPTLILYGSNERQSFKEAVHRWMHDQKRSRAVACWRCRSPALRLGAPEAAGIRRSKSASTISGLRSEPCEAVDTRHGDADGDHRILSRPTSANDVSLSGRSFKSAMGDSLFREQYLDAIAAVINAQEAAGLDIVTDGDARFDLAVGGKSWFFYPIERLGGINGHRDLSRATG